MSVRHVHARPGEYIAVHRQYGSRGSGSGGGGGYSGGGGDGCFILLPVIFLIWIIISLWKVLLTLAIICLAGWLIWIFRRPLWAFVCWLCSKLGLLFSAGWKGIQAWYSQKKISQNNGSANGNSTGFQSNYGKIRQHRRRY